MALRLSLSKSVIAVWTFRLGFDAESADSGRVSVAGDDGERGYRPSVLGYRWTWPPATRRPKRETMMPPWPS
ncbi:hypothetical protein BH24ACT15_BH24ACT15_36060 [soil metagenome]